MKKGYLILIVVLIVALITILILEKSNKKDLNKYDFKIYFFNAGKADAIILSKKDKYIMIDTGEESLGEEILNYFTQNNIKKLDYLIITHFDKDHVGSASKIINNLEIGEILQSNYPKDSKYYDNYINALKNKNVEAKVISDNYEINIDDIKIVVNGPQTIYKNNESNNSSLITSITYKNKKFLFMGDAQNARIKDFLTINSETYDFLKLPYHGHYLKSLDDLFKTKAIKYAIITSALKDDKTIELLDKYNIKYYLTGKGNITLYTDGEDIIINQ